MLRQKSILFSLFNPQFFIRKFISVVELILRGGNSLNWTYVEEGVHGKRTGTNKRGGVAGGRGGLKIWSFERTCFLNDPLPTKHRFYSNTVATSIYIVRLNCQASEQPLTLKVFICEHFICWMVLFLVYNKANRWMSPLVSNLLCLDEKYCCGVFHMWHLC